MTSEEPPPESQYEPPLGRPPKGGKAGERLAQFMQARGLGPASDEDSEDDEDDEVGEVSRPAGDDATDGEQINEDQEQEDT